MSDEKLDVQNAEKRKRRKLGWGLRACQLYFVLLLAGALGYALATPPAEFAYDFSFVHGFAVSALSCVCIWLFQKRAQEARLFAICSALFCAAISVFDMSAMDAFGVVASRLGFTSTFAVLGAQYAFAAMVVSYLAIAPHVKKVLSVPLDHNPIARTGHSYDLPLKERIGTWVFWRDLMIYFFVFSFAGHWAEMFFCLNIYWGVFMGDVDFSEVMLWHQWLFPYCAEGVAVVLIAVVLTPIKEWLLRKFGWKGPGHERTWKVVVPAVIVSIIVTAIVCTTVDFTCGMICNQNYEVWDYREIPFNFMGQVCLQNSTVYTIAATLILWIFYPLMDTILRRMPKGLSDGLFFALLGVYAFSALLHFMYVADAGLIVGAFEM